MTKKKTKDEKRVELDVRNKTPFFENYDYGGPADGDEVSPGTGLYNGEMDKYDSVTDFLNKSRKRKCRKNILSHIIDSVNTYD